MYIYLAAHQQACALSACTAKEGLGCVKEGRSAWQQEDCADPPIYCPASLSIATHTHTHTHIQ